MKRGRLPLTALRSFEAAGRLLSFGRAADELFVSQAAISRQVRELEEILGQPLFTRLHRRVELTQTGQGLLGQLTASFDDIDRELSRILPQPRLHTLKVSVEPSFAGEFLIQRLNAFQSRYPDIEITLEADSRLIEFREGEAEVAVRYGGAGRSWPGVEARHLHDLTLTPVATPALLAASPLLRSPEDLAQHTLIHDQTREGWAKWLRAAGIGDIPARGPVYTEGALAIQAAKLSHGIALGDRLIDGDDIASGRLVCPFKQVLVGCGTYWIVARNLAALSDPAKAFVDWLDSEVRSVREQGGLTPAA